MNNLKRVLSLGLSGVMLAGLLTVGASAANFTDADKIDHSDAVDTLVALNIVSGKEDGSYFDPEGNVTRAEMAKMIAVAMNGGSDATTGVKGTASFSDIKGHWAESYIEYCYDLGIISGRGDGTFDPGANVTGLEATKMILTALGYDAEAYQLTGAKWSSRTDELARQADPALYDELTGVSMTAPASRDTAAQLLWNGLQNTTKRVRPTTGINTGSIEWTYENGDVMLTERYGAHIVTGTFVGNDKIVDTIEEGFIQIATGADGDVYYDFPSDLDIAHVGETVKVIFKDGKNSLKKVGPDKNDIIYGTFPTGETETVTATKNDVKNNYASDAKIKVGSSTYTLADSVDVITNYDIANADTFEKDGNSNNATNNGDKDTEKNSDLTAALKATNGDTVKLLLNDGKVVSIYITTSKIAVVTSKNSTKIGINNGVGTLTIADNDIEDGLAVDDVVVVTTLYKNKATADGAYTIVTKAETVEGEVDGYDVTVKNSSVTKNTSITVDGKSYKVKEAAAAMFTDDVDGDALTDFNDTGLIGEEVKLYLVNGFVAAAVQTTESASNYSVVTDVKKDGEAGATFDALQIQVMDSTGTKSIYSVAKSSDKEGDTPASSDYPKGTLVTYTINKDGEAVLKKVAKAAPAAGSDGAGYEKSIKSVDGTVTTKDCVLFATNGSGSWKAYNIRDLGDLDFKGVTYSVSEKDGKVVAVAAELGKTPKGVTSTAVYGIVTAAGGTVKVGGDPYKTFTAYSNGEKYTLNVPTDDESLSKGAIVWFQPSADGTYDDGDIVVIDKDTTEIDGNTVAAKVYIDSYDKADALLTYYTEVEAVTNDDGETTGYKGKGDAQVKAVDDKVAIYYIDVDTPDSPESGSVSKFDTFSGNNNAIVVLDDDTVIAILVEVSNEGPIVELD